MVVPKSKSLSDSDSEQKISLYRRKSGACLSFPDRREAGLIRPWSEEQRLEIQNRFGLPQVIIADLDQRKLKFGRDVTLMWLFNLTTDFGDPNSHLSGCHVERGI